MESQKARATTQQTDYTIITITALVVLIATIFIFFILRKRRASRRGILLTGLCDSGKTIIYAHLIQNKLVQTQTSIKENIGTYSTEKGSLKIIDIPGHERLRDKFFEQYKSAALGIVYVVDSMTLQQNIKDAAEFLYNILSDGAVSSNATSLLILCNKQDLPLAKTSTAIKNMFEKELNTLRLTKSSQLDSVDPKVKRAKVLLDGENDFTFGALHPIKVDFAQSYLVKKEDGDSVDIIELEKWMCKIGSV